MQLINVNIKNKNGFTIIELLVSIFLFAVVMLGLASSVILINKVTLSNLMRDEAVDIARTEIEKLRVGAFSSVGNLCNDNCSSLSTDPNCYVERSIRNANVKFGRKITVIGSNIKTVTIEVCWDIYNRSYNYITRTVITHDN
jgi:type IV pilus assembly protein PilV